MTNKHLPSTLQYFIADTVDALADQSFSSIDTEKTTKNIASLIVSIFTQLSSELSEDDAVQKTIDTVNEQVHTSRDMESTHQMERMLKAAKARNQLHTNVYI